MQYLNFSPLRTSCRTCASVPGRIKFILTPTEIGEIRACAKLHFGS
jgi:hypothetical protein